MKSNEVQQDGGRLILWHRTDSAEAILAGGFRNPSTARFIGGMEFTGVWLSNIPLDANEGATGRELLCVQVDATLDDLEPFELCEEGKPYREWCIPAEWLATRTTIELVDEFEDPRVPDVEWEWEN